MCILLIVLTARNVYFWSVLAKHETCDHFFDTAFSSAVYCAAGTQQKTAVYIDGTLANFSMHLSGSLGTLLAFRYEKMRSAWTELSPIFF